MIASEKLDVIGITESWILEEARDYLGESFWFIVNIQWKLSEIHFYPFFLENKKITFITESRVLT